MKSVVILDDDVIRIEKMEKTINEFFPEYTFVHFCDSNSIIEWLDNNFENVVLISLDHDLDVEGQTKEPGTGRDVADYLHTKPPYCPVIIHSTNHFGREGMKYTLLDSGWQVKMVLPTPDYSWIKTDWGSRVKELIF